MKHIKLFESFSKFIKPEQLKDDMYFLSYDSESDFHKKLRSDDIAGLNKGPLKIKEIDGNVLLMSDADGMEIKGNLSHLKGKFLIEVPEKDLKKYI